MLKPTSLEMILSHTKDIPIFKNMEDSAICVLVNHSKIKTINKNEVIVKETFINTYIHVVIYGSFNVFVMDNKIGYLQEGDMFGIGNVVYGDGFSVSKITVKANSHKNLLLSFQIKLEDLKPSVFSARFYQNIAIYFANKISIEHKNFGNKE